MACLAVNANDNRLTEDFTITESDNKVFTVSSNFTLLEEPDVDLTIDIVYTPYFDLLFFPTFYHNTLYADGVNGGSSTEGRIVKRPANIKFNETNMKLESTIDGEQVVFYVDSFQNINNYVTKLVDLVKRYLCNIGFSNYNINNSALYALFTPMFELSSYKTIIENLKTTATNAQIETYIKGENREKYYPVYIVSNPDNASKYKDYFYLNTYEQPLLNNFPEVLIINENGDLILDFDGMSDDDIANLFDNFSRLKEKLLSIDKIQLYNVNRTNDRYVINLQAGLVNSVYAKTFKNVDIGDTFNSYFEKDEYLEFTKEQWEYGEYENNVINIDDTVITKNSDNYIITTPTAECKVDDKDIDLGIVIPITLPYYGGYPINLGS